MDNSIHEEYEKIFGAPKKTINLFDTEEEYNSIRQYVVDAERIYDVKKQLPFAGIEICQYDEYRSKEIVSAAEKKGYRIFYVKKYDGKKLIAYAAAYHNPRIELFTILEEAFFPDSAFVKNMQDNLSQAKKIEFLNNFRYNNSVWHLRNQTTAFSASLFASLVFGEKVTFREWKDSRCKTLAAYYPK